MNGLKMMHSDVIDKATSYSNFLFQRSDYLFLICYRLTPSRNGQLYNETQWDGRVLRHKRLFAANCYWLRAGLFS